MRASTGPASRPQGKAIVITGAGRGIGRAVAGALAAQGARLVVNDIDAGLAADTVREITASGGEAVARAGSVTDPALAEALVREAVGRWGSLDGFVNNAGLFHAASLDEEDESSLRDLIEANVLGTAYCGLHALRRMRAQGSGSLVNITSGTLAGAPGLAAYAASKGAVASLTYSWAMEVAGTGVRVNAVAPNASTRMADAYESWLGTAAHGQNAGKDPAGNAPAIAFLLSDAAHAVNGQVVRVDGDELSLLTRPGLLDPPARRDTWDPEAVAAAFADGLHAYAQPPGLARVRPR